MSQYKSSKMNKKAQTEYTMIFIYRIIMIILIIGLIVGIIWFRFSRAIDVRGLESSVLSREIIDCSTEKSIFELNETKIKNCLEIGDDVFINISFKDKFITLGKKELEVYCTVKERKISGRYLPNCYREEYFVLDSNNKLNKVNIFIAMDKHEENV